MQDACPHEPVHPLVVDLLGRLLEAVLGIIRRNIVASIGDGDGPKRRVVRVTRLRCTFGDALNIQIGIQAEEMIE